MQNKEWLLQKLAAPLTASQEMVQHRHHKLHCLINQSIDYYSLEYL